MSGAKDVVVVSSDEDSDTRPTAGRKVVVSTNNNHHKNGTAQSPCIVSVDDDDDDDDEGLETTTSDTSDCEIVNIEDIRGEEKWRNVHGPFRMLNALFQAGYNDPRKLLSHMFGLDNKSIPVDPSQQWGLLLSLLTEPTPRRRLRHVNTLEKVVDLLNTAKSILVVTGAGVSVSCGIPDFRSRDGIYARLSKDYPDLSSPQAMFDMTYFLKNPKPFFKFAKEIFPGQFTPSVTHRFVALLESKEKLLRNYTQNIDTLEQAADITRLIQCHGSFATASCTTCKFSVPGEEIERSVFAQAIPYCPRCRPKKAAAQKLYSTADQTESESSTTTTATTLDTNQFSNSPTASPSTTGLSYGVLKPDIVFFGEDLPSEFHDTLAEDVKKADLVLVIGSSLKVRPVAHIPNSIPETVPQILINREPLSNHDFDVELLGDCDVIVQELCTRLAWILTAGNVDIAGTSTPMPRKLVPVQEIIPDGLNEKNGTTEIDKETPDAEEKNEKTPDAEEKSEKTPDAEEESEKTPDAEEKSEKTPVTEEKNEKTPLAEEKNEKTPDAGEKSESTPVAEEKNGTTPDADEKNETTPDAGDKNEKTPDVEEDVVAVAVSPPTSSSVVPNTADPKLTQEKAKSPKEPVATSPVVEVLDSDDDSNLENLWDVAAHLPPNSYTRIHPNQYVFPGAELFLTPAAVINTANGEEDDSSSCSNSSTANSSRSASPSNSLVPSTAPKPVVVTAGPSTESKASPSQSPQPIPISETSEPDGATEETLPLPDPTMVSLEQAPQESSPPEKDPSSGERSEPVVPDVDEVMHEDDVTGGGPESKRARTELASPQPTTISGAAC